MKKVFAFIMIGLALLLSALPVRAETGPLAGCQAPALRLTTLAGKPLALQDYVGSKKVVLTFFTSWSKSSQAQLRLLGEIAAAHPGDVQVLAVSFDKKAKQLRSFLAAANPNFPVLHDRKLTASDAFQILIIPTTFCIGRDGVIAKVLVDYDENVKKALAEWLKD